MRKYLSLCSADFPLDSQCKSMSGGERQRIFLAICISLEPETLLLDEPTSALDDKTGNILFENLTKYCRENDKTLVVISHNKELAQDFGDRVIDLGRSKMESNIVELNLIQFSLIYVLLIIVAIIMKISKVNQTKLLVVASVRMSVQLVIAGFVLTYIFENPQWYWTLAYIFAMAAFSIGRTLLKNPWMNKKFKMIVVLSLGLSES